MSARRPDPRPHLLIVGASTRAAAFSALRAGLSPVCADLFADADLLARCPVQRPSPGRYPNVFLEIARQQPGPWMYTGALENHPALVRRIAELRPLWGNAAETLERVRSPLAVRSLLKAAGIPSPPVATRPDQVRRSGRWLVKPLRSAGGAGVRFWDIACPVPRRPVYFQRFIEGEAGAAVYVGDGREARLLGATRQLVGEGWLHAGRFRYCGSIGPLPLTTGMRQHLERLGNALAAGTGLRGLFGVDYVCRDGVPWPVEVNPRYTASVEVLEYATGLQSLALHHHVFDPDAPAATEGIREGYVVGKAVLFAPVGITFPEDGPWLADVRSGEVQETPAFADVPAAGEMIAAGRPILTLFARAVDVSNCQQRLHELAADLDRRLFGR